MAAIGDDASNANAATRRPHVVVVGGGLAGASAALEAADTIRQNTIATGEGGGARVTLLDKAERVGGNSAKASSGLSAAVVAASGDAAASLGDSNAGDNDDSRALFESDLLASAQGRGDPRLAAVLAEDSARAIPWLQSRLGVELPSVVRLGGHSAARTRGPPGGAPVGFALMKAAAAALEGDELVEVRTGLKVVGLETTTGQGRGEGRVSGVVVKVVEASSSPPETTAAAAAPTATIPADAVVLATGGYAASPSLLARFAPEAFAASSGGRTTNGPWATGDALELVGGADLAAPSSPPSAFPRARGDLKARLVDLDAVQLHPTAFAPFVAASPSPPSAAAAADAAKATATTTTTTTTTTTASNAFLAPERLRGVGGILLDGRGRRFFDELGRRDAVAAAVGRAEKETGGAWLVMSEAAVEEYGRGAVGFYVSKGLMKQVADVEELAKLIVFEGGGNEGGNGSGSGSGGSGGSGVEKVADEIEASLDAHDAAAANRLRDPFGRASFASGPLLSGPFYVGKIGPALHYTMGGLAIDTEGRVLKDNDGGAKQGAKDENEKSSEAGAEGVVIPGLYAAGEAAGGVHGANRLGGCSLADCVVFGRRAGRAAVVDWMSREKKGEKKDEK